MNERELNARLDTLEVLAEAYGLNDVKDKVVKAKGLDEFSKMKVIQEIEVEIRKRIGK